MESIPLLITASREGNLKEVNRLLIDEGVDINAQAPISVSDDEEGIQIQGGDTALIQAIQSNRPSIIKRLIEGGANVNLHNSHGETALSLAVEFKNLDLVNTLLEVPGIKVDSRLLESAVFYYRGLNIKIVEALVNAGVDVNKPDHYGRTPLDLVFDGIQHAIRNRESPATIENSKQVALYLIRHGARTRPGREHLILSLTPPMSVNSVKKVLHNSAWKRRRNAVMAWSTANPPNGVTEPAMGGAGGPSSATNNNQGGGVRRRSMKKRKIAKKTRRRRSM